MVREQDGKRRVQGAQEETRELEKRVKQNQERSEMRQRQRRIGSSPQLIICKMGLTGLLSEIREVTQVKCFAGSEHSIMA